MRKGVMGKIKSYPTVHSIMNLMHPCKGSKMLHTHTYIAEEVGHDF